MERTFNAEQITVGFHPAGYRIDKTATPMNRYTKWDILPSNHWCNPKPVCFDSLPQSGWIAVDKFDWDKINMTEERNVRLC
jgi:hypothetical protein